MFLFWIGLMWYGLAIVRLVTEGHTTAYYADLTTGNVTMIVQIALNYIRAEIRNGDKK